MTRLYMVEIYWGGVWIALQAFGPRDDAEWAIATRRQANGGNGKDTDLRVSEVG